MLMVSQLKKKKKKKKKKKNTGIEHCIAPIQVLNTIVEGNAPHFFMSIISKPLLTNYTGQECMKIKHNN